MANSLTLLESGKVTSDCQVQHFLSMADIFIRKPHAIRSRKKLVAGAVLLSQQEVPADMRWQETSAVNIPQDFRFSQPDELAEVDYSLPASVIVRKVIYKGSPDRASIESVWLKHGDSGAQMHVAPMDEAATSGLCFLTKAPYCLAFDCTQHCLSLYVDKAAVSSTLEEHQKWITWLRFICFPKLLQWCNDKISLETTTASGSLKLIRLEEYNSVYEGLKSKYAKRLLDNWHSESTNPEKFIHEDLAIAAYLICLWRQLPEPPRSFIDLGCGNGLLVFILSQEGFEGGVGVDIKARKIWDFFLGLGTDLRVSSVSPKADDQFSSFDWLIGNHSDELTPWIPVMARLSQASFFLIPCCPFEFYGKFQRRNTRQSGYRDYLDYVARVGQRCGFLVEEDRLKIPSTKRICFIGRHKSTMTCDQIRANIADMTQAKEATFVPRPVDEKVRNCTQVPKSVQQEIVKIVTDHLLNEPGAAAPTAGRKEWNAGGLLAMSSIAHLLSKELLKKLKSECGGLQTLFRNHHHIFVVANGTVRLRCPSEARQPKSRRRKRRLPGCQKPDKKPCWFHENHPQGCPLPQTHCPFDHSVAIRGVSFEHQKEMPLSLLQEGASL